MNVYDVFLTGFLFIIVVNILTLIVRKLLWSLRSSRVSVHQAEYARLRLGERIFLPHEVASMSDEEAVARLAALEWIERRPIEVKARILSQINYE